MSLGSSILPSSTWVSAVNSLYISSVTPKSTCVKAFQSISVRSPIFGRLNFPVVFANGFYLGILAFDFLTFYSIMFLNFWVLSYIWNCSPKNYSLRVSIILSVCFFSTFGNDLSITGNILLFLDNNPDLRSLVCLRFRLMSWRLGFEDLSIGWIVES
jgi:hypothetical protein